MQARIMPIRVGCIRVERWADMKNGLSVGRARFFVGGGQSLLSIIRP